MARITEAEVHAAAAALDAQGIKPTTSKIREKLGSGSFSTIKTYLDSWEAQETTEEAQDVPEELESLLPAIWAKCWDIANAKFETERNRYQAQIWNMEEEIKTLEKIIEKQENEKEELEKLAEENKHLVEENAIFLDRYKEAEKKAGELQDQVEGMRGIYAAEKTRHEESEKKLEEEKRVKDLLYNENIKLREERATLTGELNTYKALKPRKPAKPKTEPKETTISIQETIKTEKGKNPPRRQTEPAAIDTAEEKKTGTFEL